jgi:hypothetical protein
MARYSPVYDDGLDADGYPVECSGRLFYARGSEEEAGPETMKPIGDVTALAIARIRRFQEIGGNCDSPIEYEMGAAILVYFERTGHKLSLCQTVDLESALAGDELFLVPQFAWSYYRSDWAIYSPVTKMALLIECDGRDFHTSAKQIAHDRTKDRAAADRGYLTMRFTGSQIHRDADGCAQRICDVVFP